MDRVRFVGGRAGLPGGLRTGSSWCFSGSFMAFVVLAMSS
jgi:hypothetical protein